VERFPVLVGLIAEKALHAIAMMEPEEIGEPRCLKKPANVRIVKRFYREHDD